MKKYIEVIIITILSVFFVSSFTACPIDDSDGNSIINENLRDDELITNYDSSIIFLNREWNKNENSIPYQLAFDPTRFLPDRWGIIKVRIFVS